MRFETLGRFLRRTSTLAHEEFEPSEGHVEGTILFFLEFLPLYAVT